MYKVNTYVVTGTQRDWGFVYQKRFVIMVTLVLMGGSFPVAWKLEFSSQSLGSVCNDPKERAAALGHVVHAYHRNDCI